MPTTRLILASLLIAAPMLCAQQAQTRPAQTRTAEVKDATAPIAAHIRKPVQTAFEPLQLTVIFRKIRNGEPTTNKTYTVAASPQQADPQIRDDNRVPVKGLPPTHMISDESINLNTDVDVQNIRKVGELISLTLRISQDNYSEPLPNESAERPSINATRTSHRYTVSPTVPMGQLTTVYSLEDGINHVRVEIQLIVQPLNAK